MGLAASAQMNSGESTIYRKIQGRDINLSEMKVDCISPVNPGHSLPIDNR